MIVSGVMLLLVPDYPLLLLLLFAGYQSVAFSDDSGVRVFKMDPETFKGVTNFSTFKLHKSSNLLLVGAKDRILAVDIQKFQLSPKEIVWEVPEDKRTSCLTKGKTETDCRNYVRLLEFSSDAEAYVCGTYAFDPQCAVLDMTSFTLKTDENGEVTMESGKSKCPFEPNHHYTAVMADGVLYTAAASNFLGTLFDISRATGPEIERIRTERSNTWLSDPEFVSSAFVQESGLGTPTGDDDKIYFFFTEVAREYDMFTKVKVPRVARVCKSDVGGMKTLQRRWTTFLKAQLVCEDRNNDKRYNVLKDVFTLKHDQKNFNSTYFYGLFTTQWDPKGMTAVCIFSLSDISKAMNGPYRDLKRTCDSWQNPEQVPVPRPGQCLTDQLKAEGFTSSLTLPDKVLTFMRDHPLMENTVNAAPVMVRAGVSYSKLAVTLTGRGTVLHLGTDSGEIHQVAVVGQKSYLLQEVPVFSSVEPVNSILLHENWALVGGPGSVARLRASGCSPFLSCEMCAKARELGCVWDTVENTCQLSDEHPGPGDVVDAALKKCHQHEGRCSPPSKDLQVSLGLQLTLPCIQLSSMPCTWEHAPHRLIRQHHSDLEVTVTEETLGSYICTCQEAGASARSTVACRRAEFHLSLKNPERGSYTGVKEWRHIMALYILCFILGSLSTLLLVYVVRQRLWRGRALNRSLSSTEKEMDSPSSSFARQGYSSSQLETEVSTVKQNGTTKSPGLTSSLLNNRSSNGHQDNHSGEKHSNGFNFNPAPTELAEISVLDIGSEKQGEEEKTGSPGGVLSEELDSLSGLEAEFSSFSLLKANAPMATGEDSGI